MDPPPPPIRRGMPTSCLKCLELIPLLERDIFVENPPRLTDALDKIGIFFESIHVSVAGPPLENDYSQLTRCKIPESVLSKPESVDAAARTTCSSYIENALLHILQNATESSDINICTNLILHGPLKEKYAHFMRFIGSSCGESATFAMNNFNSFMTLSHGLVRKLGIFTQRMPAIKMIKRMYLLMQQIIFKMVREHGACGITYQDIRRWFTECQRLRQDCLLQIQTEIQHLTAGTARATELTLEQLEDMENKLDVKINTKYVDGIRFYDQDMRMSSQPNTPPRPGGGGNKRVKKNNSNTKKYKKNNSKTKKYKKKKYKSKNTIRIIPK
jgi:hypothetical protein